MVDIIIVFLSSCYGRSWYDNVCLIVEKRFLDNELREKILCKLLLLKFY